MSEPMKGAVATTIISAVSAIIVALVTTFGAIAVSEPEAQRVKKKLEAISEIEKVSNLPIGTVTSSLLTPTLFSKAVGDPPIFNPEKSKWVIADSENDITLSRYGRLQNKRYTPDFRGMFLRGVNEGRNDGKQDPELNREAGSFQRDDFFSHSHKANMEIGAEPINGGAKASEAAGAHGRIGIMYTSSGLVQSNGGKETRPRNIAVYFYVKIN